jgi:hypothetical protein
MTTTRRRIDAAINTLADLAGEEHEALEGDVRYEMGHVIYALEQILEAKA